GRGRGPLAGHEGSRTVISVAGLAARWSGADDFDAGGDVDCTAQGPGHGAVIGVKGHDPVDGRPVSARAGLQPVLHEDPLQHERAAVQFDLTGRVGVETTLSRWDAARLPLPPYDNAP